MQKLNSSYPLSHLAERVGGKVVGDPKLNISGLASVEAPIPHHVSFIRSSSSEAVKRSLEKLPSTVAVVVGADVAPSSHSPNFPSLIVVKEAYTSFLDLIPLFFAEAPRTPGVHPSAVVDPTATIGEGACVSANCFIGPRCRIGKNFTMLPNARLYADVSIGDSVTLYSGVSIRDGSEIGDRVTIHDGAVIGADGFGYTPDPKLGLRKVPQVGNVIIQSDVEIGANSCIDRGTFGPTIIGRGTKIDNLVQIGHNTVLGNFVIVCGQAAIAGSTTIADGVVVGGGAGVADHVSIGKGIRLGGRAGVISSLTEPGDYMGFPAVPASEWRRIQVNQRKLARPSRKK